MRPSLLLALAPVALAALNEPCRGPGGIAGVCVTTSSCANAGGTTINNACPSDPDNVKCCSKPDCNNGSNGNCRWISDCAGSTVSNQCPGPSDFKCCSSGASGFGGYSRPALPGGICKTVAIAGARDVLDRWPGRVRGLICGRTGCSCSSSGNDHCCGTAVDFLVSDGAGEASMSGIPIAEWIMNNAGSLDVRYITWGQRIWMAGRDPVESWTGWRTMEDYGDITANNWDQIHVSFNR